MGAPHILATDPSVWCTCGAPVGAPHAFFLRRLLVEEVDHLEAVARRRFQRLQQLTAALLRALGGIRIIAHEFQRLQVVAPHPVHPTLLPLRAAELMLVLVDLEHAGAPLEVEHEVEPGELGLLAVAEVHADRPLEGEPRLLQPGRHEVLAPAAQAAPTRVALEVLPQVRRQVAAVAAQMALMRPLIAVPDAHVQLEIPLRRKGLVALRAGEGPLLQVHRGDMASQVAGEREAPLAMRTNLGHTF